MLLATYMRSSSVTGWPIMLYQQERPLINIGYILDDILKENHPSK